VISELDAALMVGLHEDAYCADGKLRTAVTKDVDFICNVSENHNLICPVQLASRHVGIIALMLQMNSKLVLRVYCTGRRTELLEAPASMTITC
jgi:hypothetical protein